MDKKNIKSKAHKKKEHGKSEPIKRNELYEKSHPGPSNKGSSKKPTREKNSQTLQFPNDSNIDFTAYKRALKSGNIECNNISEIEKDLFEMSDEYSLAHCVAEDMSMGAGIAVLFRKEFRKVGELLDQRQTSGGLAYLEIKGRYIYYLVTKRISKGKPTLESMFASLVKLREHMIKNNVKKLAIPQIGCGLDGLNWSDVLFMLKFLFGQDDIDIVVCNFRPTQLPRRDRFSKVVLESNKLVKDIEEETFIIYFTDETGYITNEMKDLDKKFNFLLEYKCAHKKLGSIILFTKHPKYILCGCVVRKRPSDHLLYAELENCAKAIIKLQLKFYYIAFQAVESPQNDTLINTKIINVLKHLLYNFELYVCYPSENVCDMREFSGRFGAYARFSDSYSDNHSSFHSDNTSIRSTFGPEQNIKFQKQQNAEDSCKLNYHESKRKHSSELGNIDYETCQRESKVSASNIKEYVNNSILNTPTNFSRIFFVTETMEFIGPDSFKELQGYLLDENKSIGDFVINENKNFYCIIKKDLKDTFNEKILFSTLSNLLKHDIGDIAISNLPVSYFAQTIEKLFGNSKRRIVIVGPKDFCTMPPPCVKKVTYNLAKIRKNCVILYFASPSRFPQDFDEADNKYKLKSVYDKTRKIIGVVVEHDEVDSRFPFGCIVLKEDGICYAALVGCLMYIQKKTNSNVKNIGFTAFPNYNQNRKVVAVLNQFFEGFEIIILCPGNLKEYWPTD